MIVWPRLVSLIGTFLASVIVVIAALVSKPDRVMWLTAAVALLVAAVVGLLAEGGRR